MLPEEIKKVVDIANHLAVTVQNKTRLCLWDAESPDEDGLMLMVDPLSSGDALYLPYGSISFADPEIQTAFDAFRDAAEEIRESVDNEALAEILWGVCLISRDGYSEANAAEILGFLRGK